MTMALLSSVGCSGSHSSHSGSGPHHEGVGTPYEGDALAAAQRIVWHDESSGREVPLVEQTSAHVRERNKGCVSGNCHGDAEDPHQSDLAPLACIDCHGGTPIAPENHVRPDGRGCPSAPPSHHPDSWPTSANPERTYTLLNDEYYDWIKFVNPGDLRVASETCGPCHWSEVLRVSKSLMTTAAHFWGVAAYANGIVSSKYTRFGESYSSDGVSQVVLAVPPPTPEEQFQNSEVPMLLPLPNFEISQTANIFRVFERGSRFGTAALAFNGLPVPLIGLPDKLEDPGQPNNRLSDRGFGTLNRVDLGLLNVHKTRLNDPMLSFMGTNDQPGDYRSSGCTSCHMVYANDRSPIASGPYARHGNMGQPGDDADPMILAHAGESGHPIAHEFTVGIPSSQCIVCHHHQPNSFVNPYLGFTMWTYETDGEPMYPVEEAYPTTEESHRILDRNPEGAARRGHWGDLDFLKDVTVNHNDTLKHTQFADYHGHGWMFRGAFKMDRVGNLLDEDGNIVPYDDPTKFAGALPLVTKRSGDENDVDEETETAESLRQKFRPQPGKAVHLKDIHAEMGMHCVDCHFEQDVHGDGRLYAEYQAAVEIRCQDCHGTVEEYAKLETSGPAAKKISKSHDLASLETPYGKKRFKSEGNGVIKQRSMLYKDVEWTIKQVKDTASDPDVNEKAAYAHTLRRDGTWGANASDSPFAHDMGQMECYTCHTSWITSCWGCHLPQEANWRTEQHHFEGIKLRQYATYNPQVVRDTEFLLGVAPHVKGNTIAPVRSSSALTISSRDGQRRLTYPQIGTVAANGMSGQCFNTHFTHTVRTKETRICSDCHVSENNDNNAYLAQVFLLGTNTVNFMGYHVYVGQENGGFAAVRVTEWDEPQAVIGSNLHRLAYPDRYQKHIDNDQQLTFASHHRGPSLRSLVRRAEYLYTAGGEAGFEIYDVANVANKDFSEKVVTAPFSPLGHNTKNATKNATAVALPTNNPISMSRKWRPENREKAEFYNGKPQNMHELYRYAYVSDSEEGLIIIDIDCLTDGEPRNNFTKRVATFNEGGVLDGAMNLTVAGEVVYVCCDRGIVAVSIADPRKPKLLGSLDEGFAEVGAPHINQPTCIKVQFRYAFVTDADGVKVIDVTLPEKMKIVEGAFVPVADARDIYLAKTYAYVSAGAEGLVIVDILRPEVPETFMRWSADGVINDLFMTKIATTNIGVFAYMADGRNGLRIAQVTKPEEDGPSAYGFSPPPRPELIAQYKTKNRAISLQKGLDRDRAVDESGNQHAVFGRIGGRPLDLDELHGFYLKDDGTVYTVSDDPK